jgi:hypothetical protein
VRMSTSYSVLARSLKQKECAWLALQTAALLIQQLTAVVCCAAAAAAAVFAVFADRISMIGAAVLCFG